MFGAEWSLLVTEYHHITTHGQEPQCTIMHNAQCTIMIMHNAQ